MRNSKLKTVILVLGIALLTIAAQNIWLWQKNNFNKSGNLFLNAGSISQMSPKPAVANDIYPLFFCPCCGQPLDKNKICCGSAKERIDYIDSLATDGRSEDEVVLAYVKKYGLNSFVDKNKQSEVKEKLAASAPTDRPIISLSPASYDFGDVSQQKGVAATFFELRNDGKKDLIIDRMDTSCGCTSASIVFDAKEGPSFTMPGHGAQNPTDWKVTIPPGKTAQLKVYYDPYVHIDFRGPATREISVYSNDPIDFEKKVIIELNQVD